MTDADDKAKMAAISRGLKTILQEMEATHEEVRALNVLMERVAKRLEANLAEPGTLTVPVRAANRGAAID